MLYSVTFKRSVTAFLLSLLVIATPVSAQQTKYVSDELNVPVRSGASNQHRIIKFLSSGTAVKVLGQDDGGEYTHVQLADDKDGYILNKDLMDIPSGRDRLKAASAKLDKVREENKELKNTISELRSELNKAQGENSELQNERTRLSNSIEDLKITAANPLALSRKNKELQRDLDQARADASALEKDNQKLRNNVMQEWFIIGAAVSIGSLILGIILTRIRWKQRNSWGDSF